MREKFFTSWMLNCIELLPLNGERPLRSRNVKQNGEVTLSCLKLSDFQDLDIHLIGLYNDWTNV